MLLPDRVEKMDFKAAEDLFSGLPKNKSWLGDAKFGFHYMKPYLESLNASESVLEIGSGSGLLLSYIKYNFPDLDVTGIEPIGPGFDALKPYHKILEDNNVNIQRCGYEDFNSSQKFDLIFLINVFEHLENWKDFLNFLKSKLKEGGRCVILCPNYGFPYESHFHLPVIVNKKITYTLFKRYIHNFEASEDCVGLWQSLNFVSWHGLQKECKIAGLNARFDSRVFIDMIRRLDEDPEFQKRHVVMGFFAKVACALGLPVIAKIPAFNYVSPYMKVDITLK